MLIVTSNGVPGHRVEAVLGTVIGSSIRATDVGGTLRGLGGGEGDELVRTARTSRNEALEGVWRECRARGANAVVALQFDTAAIGSHVTEVCAYGTAVVVVPLPEGEPGSTPQSTAIASRPPVTNWPTMEGQHAPGEGVRPQAAAEGALPSPEGAGSGAPEAMPSPTTPDGGQPPRDVQERDFGVHRQVPGPNWQPTADAPTADFPAVTPRAEERPQKKSWLDLP